MQQAHHVPSAHQQHLRSCGGTRQSKSSPGFRISAAENYCARPGQANRAEPRPARCLPVPMLPGQTSLCCVPQPDEVGSCSDLGPQSLLAPHPTRVQAPKSSSALAPTEEVGLPRSQPMNTVSAPCPSSTMGRALSLTRPVPPTHQILQRGRAKGHPPEPGARLAPLPWRPRCPCTMGPLVTTCLGTPSWAGAGSPTTHTSPGL